MTPRDVPRPARARKSDRPAVPGRAAAYPPARSFVVQFVAASGEFTGRAEHIVSGETGHFSSPADLVEFLEGVLLADGDMESA